MKFPAVLSHAQPPNPPLPRLGGLWQQSGCRAGVLRLLVVCIFICAGSVVSGAAGGTGGPLQYVVQTVPGWNLIANQLDSGSNSLNEVLPVVPQGTLLSTWNAQQQLFSPASIYIGGLGWSPNAALPPGLGAALNIAESTNLVFFGAPPQPQLPVVLLPGGAHLLGRQTPEPGTYEEIVGLPPMDGTVVFKWNPTVQTYDDPFTFFAAVGWFCGGGTICPGPVAQVGEAIWISTSGGFPGGGQGAVTLANLGPGWAAPVFDFDGVTPLAGNGFRAQLYGGPDGASENQLMPIGPPTEFLSGPGAGFFQGGTRVQPFVEAGRPFGVQVRVWAGGWNTFEQAVAAGAITGKSLLFSILTGGGSVPAGSLIGLQSFSLQPTPPVIVTQPQISTSSFLGDNTSWMVAAGGPPPLEYQWFRGNCPTGEFVRLPGATNAVFALNDIGVGDAGYYFVQVTNNLGVSFSTTNELVINVPAGFLSPLFLQQGFSAIAYPLQMGRNTLNELLPDVPVGTSLLKWDRVSQGFFDPYTFLGTDFGGWVDSNFNPAGSDVSLVPGEAAFVNLPSPYTLEFEGVIRAPKLPIPIGSDPFVFLGAQLPFPSTYEQLTGLAPVEGTTLDVFDAAGQVYQTFYFLNGEWNDGEQLLAAEPVLDPRQPVFISAAEPVSLITQPGDQLDVGVGSDVTFSVELGNQRAPVRYQWRRNGVNIPGATNDTYTVLNAQLTDAGRYKVVVQVGPANHAPEGGPMPAKEVLLRNAISSDSALLRMDTPRLVFDDNPNNRVMLEGASGRVQGFHPNGIPAFVGWVAPADGIATFDTLGSSFDTQLTILHVDYTGLAYDDDGGPFLSSRVAFNAVAGTQYIIEVDPFFGDTSEIVLGWSLETTPDRVPIFRDAPRSQAVLPGATAEFRAETVESGPYDYEWFFNGVSIASGAASQGQTLVSLTVPDVQTADLGAYLVAVTQSGRQATSEPAWLEIGTDPARVTTRKFDEALTPEGGAGGSGGVAASVSAGIIHRQQLFNVLSTSTDCSPEVGGVIGGALRWMHLRPEVAGLIEFDTCGSSVETALAAYTGNACLLTLAPVTNLTTLAGVDCLAEVPMTPLIRARTRFMAAQGEIYHVAVDTVPSGANGVIAMQWKLTAVPTAHPAMAAPVVVVRNQSYTLSAPVLDVPPPHYQWALDGVPIATATNASFYISAVNPAKGGLYTLTASNAAGVATYQVADLIPGELGSEGNSLALEAPERPMGTTYQWRFDGTNITGATGSMWVLPSFNLSHAGEYSVVSTHASGVRTNRVGAVHGPVVSGPILGSTLLTNAGSSVSLNVTAQGYPAPNLRWYLDGADLGADEAPYVFTAASGRTGSYSLVASNAGGVVKVGVADVYVPPQLVALGSASPGSPFRLKVVGWPGSNYLVEVNGSVSTNAPPWEPVLTNQMDPSGLLIFPDPQISDPTRFYRVSPYSP